MSNARLATLRSWSMKIGHSVVLLFVKKAITGESTVSMRIDLPTGWTKKRTGETIVPPDQQRFVYFKNEEVIGLNEEFVCKLDLARAKTVDLDPEGRGIPFVITSGFRSVEKNESVIGAVPDSAHCKGLAVDLAVESSHEVWLIVAALTAVGITRVGVYVNQNNQPTHIHCDVDTEKPNKVLFIKREGSSSKIVTA